MIKVVPVSHILEFCKENSELPEAEVKKQSRYWQQSGF